MKKYAVAITALTLAACAPPPEPLKVTASGKPEIDCKEPPEEMRDRLVESVIKLPGVSIEQSDTHLVKVSMQDNSIGTALLTPRYAANRVSASYYIARNGEGSRVIGSIQRQSQNAFGQTTVAQVEHQAALNQMQNFLWRVPCTVQ